MRDPKLSPDQTSIVEVAITTGFVRSTAEGERKKCRSLNSNGLLWRDPKDGDLWYPTDWARKRFSGALPVATEATVDASGLVETIERARTLLDDGDVIKARILAAGAYDQAKAEGKFAVRFRAAEHLVARARRLQGDALLIEARAKMVISQEWDEARDAGLVSKGGRPKPVSDGNGLTAEDTGLSRKELHDARTMVEAEKASPGVVERAIMARLAVDLEPTRASLRHAIGTRSATKEDRGDDLYETPIEAMRTLLALESFALNIVEPSVGRGAILRPLEAAGYEVAISDIIDRGIVTQHGECQGVGNFMRSVAEGGGWDIVTNPPYGPANAYAAHALREHRPRKMALLLNLNFICGFEDPDRRFVMDECPPSRVYVFTRRLPMMHRDGWDGPKASSQMNTAWLVWERNDDGTYGSGPPHLIRVDWNDYVDADPLSPGLGGHVDPIRFADAEEDFTRTTPRKTLDERTGEAREMAEQWARGQDGFTRRDLRREVGVRDSVAEALITEMMERGLIGLPDNDGVHMVLVAKCEAA